MTVGIFTKKQPLTHTHSVYIIYIHIQKQKENYGGEADKNRHLKGRIPCSISNSHIVTII